MQVTVNGTARETTAANLADLIDELGFKPPVATELNRAIVRPADRAATPLSEGDTLEVVAFVGGG